MKRLRLFLQYLYPHKAISWIARVCADNKVPFIKNALIFYFVKTFKAKLVDEIETNPYAYESYNDFFIRQLKPETRPMDPAPSSIVSPVDGCVSQVGSIQEDQLLQAKGHHYSLSALLADNEDNTFKNGAFTTLYLAPLNYHRVHMPMDGKLLSMTYVPGQLFSVSPLTVENIPNLFARNERVISLFETAHGKMAVIMVGAMIVGSITTSWAGRVHPPRRKSVYTIDYSADQINLKKGDEMGYFSFGSTVILLFEKDMVQWLPTMKPNNVIKLGETLCHTKATTNLSTN